MTDRRFIDDLIQVINDYRTKHQVEPLRHNAVISTVSQSWADRLARNGSMQHNPNRNFNGQTLGENLAMKWSSDRQDYTGKEVADQWYSEISKYDFNRHSGPGTGHFTQLVWKTSREIGIGRSQSRDGKWFVVANFFPAGNVNGRYADNVFPPRAGTSTAGISQPSAAGAARHVIGAPPATPSDGSVWSRARTDRTAVPTEPVLATSAKTLVVTPRSIQGAVVVERKQESRTVNGITTTKVIETHRDSGGRIQTVTRETVEPSGSRGSAAAAVSTGGPREISIQFNAFNLSDASSTRLHPLVTQQQTTASTVDCADWLRAGATPVRTEMKRYTASPTTPSSEREFIEQVVRQHNIYRRQHGNVGDLKLNDELSASAERWARHLACIGRLQHSDINHSKTNEPLGENLAYKYSSRKEGYTGEEVVSQWYSEIKQFNFKKPESGADSCGHFTQVVWKASREIGVGRAFADGGLCVYVVCHYSPAGNVGGRFKDNVFPCK